MNKRLIAIHLPQFHPFKENDEWWGKGFTEWTNVAKAKPRYRGHYQPHIPADLGFYDLRLEESRIAQAELAKKYGIYGFCYYHYWFNGKRLMERPVNEILSSGKPDYPFMLCWANENWTRNWDGGYHEVLIEQRYSKEDFENHMRYLCEGVFNDPRYIKIDNKPFFIVYKPQLFPDIKDAIKIWRNVSEKYGIQLYLGYMTRYKEDFVKDGFDCAIDFHPHDKGYLVRKNDFLGYLLDYKNSNILAHAYGKLFSSSKTGENPFKSSYVYADYVKYACNIPTPSFKMFPGLTPSWDNSPRRRKGFFELKNSTPKLYGQWLSNILKKFQPYSPEENFVFVNAWNEWAEGNHLEPDLKWGRRYLEETLKQIDSSTI